MPDTLLRKPAAERFKPFQADIVSRFSDKLHSITITGSALTDDFDPDRSDINSVFVLHRMDLGLLEGLAPLGKKYSRRKIGAPLIMTPGYIQSSLDVFPLEFMNIRLLHETVFGQDLFADLEIDPAHLRLQCERELKVRLIGLRQGYIAAAGDSRRLAGLLVDAFSGYIPLFRGILWISGQDPPLASDDVLAALETVCGVDAAAFRTIRRQKKKKTRPAVAQLNAVFEKTYGAIEKLGDITNAIRG